MKDLEKNNIVLAETPNKHILAVGRSGQGKTWWCVRKLEESYEAESNTIVFDYSASYTKAELKKAKFKYTQKYVEVNPFLQKFYWKFFAPDHNFLVKDFRDSVLQSLGIASYYQKKLLEEAIEQVLIVENQISVPLLITTLETMQMKYSFEKDKCQNITHLLTRLDPFSSIENLYFECKADTTNKDKKTPRLIVLQFSDFTELQRKFLTQLCLEMYWREKRRVKQNNIILLDEFQNLNIRAGGALSGMLREGRKFGLSVILSSQFVSNYRKTEIETLMQVGNILFFRPTESDLKFSAKLISLHNISEWLNILDELRIGEFILKGNYHINNNQKIVTTPIICHV